MKIIEYRKIFNEIILEDDTIIKIDPNDELGTNEKPLKYWEYNEGILSFSQKLKDIDTTFMPISTEV